MFPIYSIFSVPGNYVLDICLPNLVSEIDQLSDWLLQSDFGEVTHPIKQVGHAGADSEDRLR